MSMFAIMQKLENILVFLLLNWIRIAAGLVLSGIHGLFNLEKAVKVSSGLQTSPYKVVTECPGTLK